MAIFRVPKINTDARSQITLSPSEIVYDSDKTSFFGGDGETAGGVEIGKYAGLKIKKERILLTRESIDSRRLLLSKEPENTQNITLIPEGGIEQVNGIDFIILGREVSWLNLGLDGFLEVGEFINVIYYYY